MRVNTAIFAYILKTKPDFLNLNFLADSRNRLHNFLIKKDDNLTN